ncbi:MAG TPA: GNAT family N-acetyltransferase, partial [Candidatus Sulfotelmatobacter sp.]|nr:GNAT family N-acetyltransferase [Candidatus Sulfotelmatobacter sp.]
MTGPIERPMTPADVPACLDVFFSSINELFARWNQPPIPSDERDGLTAFFGDLAFGEGGRAWVAAGPDDRPVGFGIAVEREATWYLAFLFIEPGHQVGGLGRAILRRLLPEPGSPAAAPGALRHTCIDALQP